MNPLAEMILLFLLLCALRVPVPFGLGLTSLLIILQIGVDTRQLAIHLYKGLELFPLLAVPFFLLAGNLMNAALITDRLVELAQSVVGRFRGGLAHVNVLVSMIFAGVSGSSTADAAGEGAVIIPAMVKAGFSPAFSAAITAASSTMGNIIPPSIYMVLYGSLASESIGALFLGGAIPGVLVGLSQMALAQRHAVKHNLPVGEAVPLGQVAALFVKAIPVLLVSVIVVGGIIWGWFTATEAAVAAVVYTLLLGVIFYRTIKVRDLPGIFAHTARGYSAVLFTIANASVFGWLVAYLNGPDTVGKWLEGVSTNPIIILSLVALLLLVLGTFLSEIATIIIFLPIFQRMQEVGGIHPIQMGLVVVMMLCLGLITPPYGVCLLIDTDIAQVSLTESFKETIPFILVFLAIVMLVILFPDLVLFLPRLIMPQAVLR